jgi:hypothetical protein
MLVLVGRFSRRIDLKKKISRQDLKLRTFRLAAPD